MAIKAINIKDLRKAVDARSLRERALLFAAAAAIIFSLWLVFVSDTLTASRQEKSRLIANTVNQINNELNRNQNVRDNYTRDPNAFIRTSITRLEQQVNDIDTRLLSLYGELILPQQMAGVLTQILQGETTLELVSFENLAPQPLVTGEAGVAGAETINVYRHGLKLQFEGDYLETIRFLQRVEALGTSFFWDNLTFQVQEYPVASITLNIFTLSTQRGFIGV